MSSPLMSAEDLIRITGAKRYSKQRRWFKDQFGIDAVCNDRGVIIMTWPMLEALVFKKWGIATAPEPHVELCFD